MDTPVQEKPTVFFTQSFPKLTTILIPLLTLVTGVVIGFGASYLIAPQQTTQAPPPQAQPQTAEKTQIPDSELPVDPVIFKNPIIYQWSGSVEGTLVAKSDDSITIKDDKGNSIEIPLKKPPAEKTGTIFFDLTKGPKTAKIIPFKDVLVDSRLRGNFYVIPGNTNMIVGGSFEIIEKAAP